MRKAQRGLAWIFLVGGLTGFLLSMFEIIAKEEPKLVLLLSWTALIYEGFNSVILTGKKDGERDG